MNTHQFRILITSVGTARPSASAAIAKGLGLPVATVVARLYSAPAILIDKIDESIATQMVNLLISIGYSAEVQNTNAPTPVTAILYDVAIYLEDARKFQHAVKKLSGFVGISEADASQMILSPPGIVLGSVSKVTIQALSDQMGSDISILSSPADTALYSFFLNQETSTIVYKRIVDDIKKAGYAIENTTDLVAANIDHRTAKELWQRYQSTGTLKVINQDFIRFDLILQKAKNNQAPDPGQMKVMQSLAGVPADMVEEVIASAPITLMESVPQAKIAQYSKAFSEQKLSVDAVMITFQTLGLEILSIPDRVSIANILQSFGLHQEGHPLPPPPLQIPVAIPEIQARVIRAVLEDAGAEVNLVELSI